MRSCSNAAAPRIARAAAIVLLGLACGSFAAEGDDPTPTDAEITAAVEELKADPNLAGERKTRVLQWKDDEDEEPETEPAQWLLDLMKWIGESGRLVVWLLIMTLVALLVVLIVRIVRDFRPAQRARGFQAPTHVQDLDIRPESLPDDVGGAARELWQQGEHRAALSLLYRGTLSRMAHAYELPIRHSMTEGDCVDLARQQMDPVAGGYVARLVRVWQLAVYGGYEPADDDVYAACRDFGTALRTQPEGTVAP